MSAGLHFAAGEHAHPVEDRGDAIETKKSMMDRGVKSIAAARDPDPIVVASRSGTGEIARSDRDTCKRMSIIAFRSLHRSDEVLLLPNAWDALSARVAVEHGARAVATSSAAMSWAHGRADGEQLPQETLLATVRELARAVNVPVSVDLETGYSTAPDEVAAFVAAVADAGAVGINLEDGNAPPEVLAAKIAAVKRATGDALFVNARTDVYLKQLVAPEAVVTETQRRARLYRDAGADGLFVPGIIVPPEIATIARGTELPLNVLARPTLPSVRELHALGVRRVSIGCALAQAAAALVRRATRELVAHGTYTALFADSISVAELNTLFRA